MDNKIFTKVGEEDHSYDLVIEWVIPFSKNNKVRSYPVTKEFTYMLREEQDSVIQSLYEQKSTGEEQGHSWKLIEIETNK